MPTYIKVKSRYSKIHGIYKNQGKYDQNPYYQNPHNSIAIYKLYNKHWVLGTKLGSKRVYSIDRNSKALNPTQIESWKKSTHFFVVSEFKPPKEIKLPQLLKIKDNNDDHLTGLYSKQKEKINFHPVFKNEEKSIFLYYEVNKESWTFSFKLNSNKYIYTLGNSSYNPIDTASSNKRIIIQKYEIPQIIEKQNKKDIVVLSIYSNIDGLYKYQKKIGFNYPIYFNEWDNLYFWRDNFNDIWYLSGYPGNKRYYFNGYAKDDPTQIKKTEYKNVIQNISFLNKPNIESLPKLIGISSVYYNLDGTYKLSGTNSYGYPIYENNEDGLFLWHNYLKKKWILSAEVGNNYHYITLPSDDPNLLTIDPKNYSTILKDIYEITWLTDTQGNDDSYIDPNFKLEFTSLGNDIKIDQNLIEWIRVTELNRDLNEKLFDEINPEDLCQGRIGNCWLIAAIACVAEYPQIIENVFCNKKTINGDHKYEFNFYDILNDDFIQINIDDFIPCEKRLLHEKHAKPIFCTNDNIREVWPLLLEKAFAKYVKSYSNLIGGNLGWAWQILTGINDQDMYIKQKDGWMKYNLDLKSQKNKLKNGDLRPCPYNRPYFQKPIQKDELIQLLLSLKNQSKLIGCSINGGMEDELQNGLITNHAYSLLTINEKHNLVKLRNPWGNEKEYTGKYSDNDDYWNKYEHKKKEIFNDLNHESKKDGNFLMDIDDFINNFDRILIMKLDNLDYIQ